MTGLGEKLIDKRIDAKLASMGGDLLATYGPKTEEHPDDVGYAVFAHLGGFLLERFGNSTSHVEDEFPPPTSPTGSVEP